MFLPEIVFKSANWNETQPAGPCRSLRLGSSGGPVPKIFTWGSCTGAPLTGLEPLESGIPPASSSPLTMLCYSSEGGIMSP